VDWNEIVIFNDFDWNYYVKLLCNQIVAQSFNWCMLYKPQNSDVGRHIDSYWIVDDAKSILGNASCLHGYPGITPDMIIVLDGYYTFEYVGQYIKQSQSRLFSFIHNEVKLNLATLNSFILVKFKSRALGALQPFVQESTEQIMQNPVDFSDSAFGGTISQLANWISGLSKLEIVTFLDHWFLSYYKKEREGFVIEMAENISPTFDIQKIMAATNYSYSTIERHFKRETGLTPKKYQSLRRCKTAVSEICMTRNNDWMYFIDKYNYYDQSHFIREIQRYTKFTPSQLLNVPNFLTYRPIM